MNSKTSNLSSHSGFIAVLIASILWGTTGTAASYAPNLSPLAIGAIAMGGGGLLQALLAHKKILDHLPQIKFYYPLLLIGMISVAIYPLAFYSSMRMAGITIGTVVSIGSAPLFTALLEKFFDKKALSLKWFISLIFGVIGVLLLSVGETHSHGSTQSISTDQKTIGIILGLIAALTYSLYSWAAKKMIDRGVDSKASMGLIFGFGALILLPTLFFTGSNLFDESVNLYVVAYMMLIPMFLGYLLFGYALKTISASTATTLTLFEPLVAALFAVLLVGEQLAPIGWVGMVLIFVCLAVLSKTDRPK
ncbi:DMT family transporter [Acinetobacter junii]|uniref:DMT family transporter n=1 Tax=Acinetobacter junii TaxID=40215 RepID=UPI0005B31CDA|nr:EamA family transporter [Acinetobacter junii]MBL8282131.1 EamA family transporter [Acinetobacter junii]MDH0718653.1 EamA family transporter [Acinetobacter junii]MQZ56946.1 EamA family transporter [Acinetobacter junii]QQV65858.1 Putative membrane protein [Acinetobacter junii]QUS49035.1 EamA family transporter [Acinetobacter junii]